MSRATLAARMGVTAASILVSVGLSVGPALATSTDIGPANSPSIGPANASPSTMQVNESQTKSQSHAAERAKIVHRHNKKVHKVIREARRQKGKPYEYGAAGPHGFDCSGLVRFVFMHAVHRSLPHNASQQYHSLRHISRRNLEVGDLVFVDNGGYVSHVGIYDGHGYWWVAPHTGTHVKRQKIYDAHLVYARVLVYHQHPPHHHHNK